MITVDIYEREPQFVIAISFVSRFKYFWWYCELLRLGVLVTLLDKTDGTYRSIENEVP